MVDSATQISYVGVCVVFLCVCVFREVDKMTDMTHINVTTIDIWPYAACIPTQVRCKQHVCIHIRTWGGPHHTDGP